MRNVSMMPGQIAFTRTPSPPSSGAIAQVSAWIPAFDAEYAAVFAPPSSSRAIDEMLTMLPPSPWADHVPSERAAHVEGAVEVHVDHRAPLVDGRGRRPARGRRRARRPRCSPRCRPGRARRCTRRASASTASGSDTSLTTGNARRPSARTSVGDRVDVAPARCLLVLGVPLGRAAGAGEDHVAAGTCELHRDRPSDRPHAPGAGDHCDLAVEPVENQSTHGSESGLR